MPRSRKINLDKVRASLDAVCPKCGRLIPPAEVRCIDFERIECPGCGERFLPGSKTPSITPRATNEDLPGAKTPLPLKRTGKGVFG